LENLNSKELLNLWKKGKTLYASIYVFTASNLQKKYNDLEQEDKSRNPWKDDPSAIPNISGGLAAVSETIFHKGKMNDARDELKWNLLENILSEKVIGLGYEAPVTTVSKPKIIPLHLWPRKIKELNWDNSSILKHGINFSDIRLVKKSAFKKKPDNKKPISLPKIRIEDKKTGRPSLKEKVIEAYKFLKKEDSIDYSKTLKSHTEIIQKTVQALNPEITGTAGMAHEAIRRAISERFKVDKANL
jgi:hypothetical protein